MSDDRGQNFKKIANKKLKINLERTSSGMTIRSNLSQLWALWSHRSPPMCQSDKKEN
jgi:hypothetical protein